MIVCEEALYSRASLVYDRFVESAPIGDGSASMGVRSLAGGA